MKTLLLTALFFGAFATSALAKTVTLTGDRAYDFASRHFPDGDIPGRWAGIFKYINRHGVEKQGYAECTFQGMQGHNEGFEDFCVVQY